MAKLTENQNKVKVEAKKIQTEAQNDREKGK